MNTKKFISLVLGIIALNVFSEFAFVRFDLTKDKRYTLSQVSKDLVKQVDEPMTITLFLDGKLPHSFKKMQTEVKHLVKEYQSNNSNIKLELLDLIANDTPENASKINGLYEKGMRPLSVSISEKGKQSQEMIFPWGTISYKGKEILFPLLKNTMAMSTEETINSSVQHLEYAISDAIKKAVWDKDKKIAIIKGIGEPHDIEIADLLMSLRESYYIAPFVLDSVVKKQLETQEHLKEFDAILVNKPNKDFSEAELQVLDQYIVNGGKALFFIDQVQADKDSLSNTGNLLAYPKDNSLGNLFFKYGVRINPVLVKDEVGTPIKLAVGKQGSQTQYEEFVWKFSPYSYPTSLHPIVKNIEGVKFDFTSTIDTLKNDVKKTILLHSSPYSKTVGTPTMISLQMIDEEVNPEEYQGKGNLPLAVLLEGDFTSMYHNRIKAFEDKNFKDKGQNNQIIVVADGDVVRNQLDQNLAPLELGYDKWTNKLYGNKDFVLNSINYLLDDFGILNLRTKEVQLALLDKNKVSENYSFIQLKMTVLPLVVISIFGGIFVYLRKKKYGKIVTN